MVAGRSPGRWPKPSLFTWGVMRREDCWSVIPAAPPVPLVDTWGRLGAITVPTNKLLLLMDP